MATTGNVLRRGPDRVLGGVCAGLGHYFNVDPLLVRIGFVVLAIAHGLGIVLYLILWLLMEPPVTTVAGNQTLGQRIRNMGDEIRDDFRSGFSRPAPPATTSAGETESPATPPPAAPVVQRGVWIGVILIALGAYFLLDNIGVFHAVRWDLFWPVVLIAVGLVVLLRRR